jgi:hypothetical protein
LGGAISAAILFYSFIPNKFRIKGYAIGAKIRNEQHAFTQNYKLQFFNANSRLEKERKICSMKWFYRNAALTTRRYEVRIASTWVSVYVIAGS